MAGGSAQGTGPGILFRELVESRERVLALEERVAALQEELWEAREAARAAEEEAAGAVHAAKRLEYANKHITSLLERERDKVAEVQRETGERLARAEHVGGALCSTLRYG